VVDVNQLLQSLGRIDQKKILFSKLASHLSLLIDDAMPDDMLPVNVPKDVAVEVRAELEARIRELDDEQTALVKPPPAKKPAPKKRVTPKKKPAKRPVTKKKATEPPKPPVSVVTPA